MTSVHLFFWKWYILTLHNACFIDFTARAEEFIANLNFSRLVILEKNKTLSISLDARKLSKDLIVIANESNSTIGIDIKHQDFSVSLRSSK